MGAKISVEGNRAIIQGVPSLSGAYVEGMDLRASASLVVAGLAAEGTTYIHEIHHLRRGYETFEENFSPIFAAIEREFSIQIGKEERMRIEKHFSKESLSAIADSMETFEESDPITGIHGMHIASCTSLKKQKEFERLSKPLIHALDRIKSIPDDL
jgi:hypothetical protein